MLNKGNRRTVLLLLANCSLAILCSSSVLAPSRLDAELVPIAFLPGSFGGYYPCGNGNHDSCEECYGTCGGVTDYMLVCEDTGGNSFREIRPGLIIGCVYDFGYTDGDSLAEMLAAVGMETLNLYRAVSRDSLPTHRVWSVPTPYELYYARFCDLDHDGHQDVAACGRLDAGLYVYENRGGDSWAEVPFPRRPYGDVMGNFAIGDFDSDGHAELAGGNNRGDLLLYECTGNDQYARVCSLGHRPYEIEDYCHAAANDMDGDGHPKLISLFRRLNLPADSCFIRIYEEPEHNQLVCVDSLTCAYNPFAAHCVGSGDIDGDGKDEFSVSTGLDVRLFKSCGLHQYIQIWQVNLGSIFWTEFYDINGDARDELIISTADTTYVYEDTSGLGTAVFEKLPQRHAVTIQPTIARLGAPVMFSGVPPGADIEVLSLDGRLVSRTQGVRQSSWSWNLRNQSGNLVPAGTYFAVIRSKGKATSLKLCLVK